MIKTLLKVKTLKIYNISLSTTAMYCFIGSETYIFSTVLLSIKF